MNDIIIIGAGVAGLAAAKELHRRGFDVLIIEARDRIGGRIFTVREPDLPEPVELGAEFIHGRPTVTFDLVQKAGLKIVEAASNRLVSEQGSLREQDDFWPLVDSLHAQIDPHEDITYQQFLDRLEAPKRTKQAAKMWVEGYNAARAEIISAPSVALVESAAAESDGDHNFRLPAGYDAVVQELAKNLPQENLRLSETVLELKWKPGKVEIRTTAATYTARKVIITVPLGVLKAGVIAFDPPLTAKSAALACIEMGHAMKIILSFRERWWEKLAGPFAFVINYDATLPVWWTQRPADAASLTGWASGPAADPFFKADADAIRAAAIASLAEIFGIGQAFIEDQLIACHFHNWTADPFARGVYSYAGVGGIEAARQLAQPLENTLFFAGEATDFSGHNGTVHAAIASGYRVADEI